MINQEHGELSVRQQCKLLGVSRSNLYYKEKERSDEALVANEISEIWSEMPAYGYRKITKELQRRNYKQDFDIVMKKQN